MSLARALDHHAQARPRHPALLQGTQSIDHAAFREIVARTATHLRSLGLASGDVVGVALRDTVEHVIAMFALARAGIVMLPMDVRWTAEEKANVAAHFGAKRVLVERDETAVLPVRTSTLDNAWHEAVAAALPCDDAYPSDDAPLLISLSSGTTGRPKGPMVTHSQFLARFRTHWINLGLASRDRYVSATPLYFGGGRTFAMSVVYSGGTLILYPPPYEIEALADEVARRGASSLFLVPTQLRKLLAAPVDVQRRLADLRLLVSSGAPLAREERRAIRDQLCAGFFEYYASTEGGGTTLLAPEDQEAHGDSVGRAIFGVDIEIVDEAGHRLPAGETGRLRYRGPGCVTAFHNDPEASAEAFRDGWFYPGDLASIDRDGFVTLRGRAKDMIIRGGVNVHPAEIEAVLREHPEVEDAAVLGVPHALLGEEVAAVVVARQGVDPVVLAAFLQARIAPYKVPSRWRFAEGLPRNAGGKVLKAVLAEQFGRP